LQEFLAIVIISYNLCFVVRNKDVLNIPKKQMKKYGEAINQTAEIHNCTASYVRLVIRGKRQSEAILSTYNKLVTSTNKLVEKLKA